MAIATIVYLFASLLACSMALHPPRRSLGPVADLQQVSTNNHSSITDATIVASDGAQLRAWLMRPAHYNGKAVIILHGVADNRLGAAGFAQNFLPVGYTVLLPDSRAHGASGGATRRLLEHVTPTSAGCRYGSGRRPVREGGWTLHGDGRGRPLGPSDHEAGDVTGPVQLGLWAAAGGPGS